MSRWAKRSAFGFLIVAALLPSITAPARIVSAPGCREAQKLADGSWLIVSPMTFGRAGTVDAGAIVYEGTVINGVDLGAVLDARCFRKYRIEPDYDSWLWPPNGYPSWTTRLQ